MPKISVIVPTHNREKMCKRAIASVLAQSFDDYEIIVSNDSEEDYDTVGSYIFQHPKVSYYKRDPEGYDKNYMFLVDKAVGEYILCLEDDDYIINKGIFQIRNDHLKEYQDVNVLLMHNALDYKDALSKKGKSFKDIYTNNEFFELFPSISVEFQFGQMFSKAELLKDIIKEEVPKRYGSVNTDAFIFLLMCLHQGNIAHLNMVGYMITINGENQSWDNFENCFFGGNSYIQDVYKRATHMNLDLEKWKDDMEYAHISHILRCLPQYLEEVEIDKHS